MARIIPIVSRTAFTLISFAFVCLVVNVTPGNLSVPINYIFIIEIAKFLLGIFLGINPFR